MAHDRPTKGVPFVSGQRGRTQKRSFGWEGNGVAKDTVVGDKVVWPSSPVWLRESGKIDLQLLKSSRIRRALTFQTSFARFWAADIRTGSKSIQMGLRTHKQTQLARHL